MFARPINPNTKLPVAAVEVERERSPAPSLPVFATIKPFKVKKKTDVKKSGTFGTARRCDPLEKPTADSKQFEPEHKKNDTPKSRRPKRSAPRPSSQKDRPPTTSVNEDEMQAIYDDPDLTVQEKMQRLAEVKAQLEAEAARSRAQSAGARHTRRQRYADGHRYLSDSYEDSSEDHISPSLAAIAAGLNSNSPLMLSSDFVSSLDTLRQKHAENMKNVENLYNESTEHSSYKAAIESAHKRWQRKWPKRDIVAKEYTKQVLPKKKTGKYESKRYSERSGEKPERARRSGSIDLNASITVPDPFEFTERDVKPKESITKRRFKEYMDELKRKEEEPFQYQFRANPIPASTMLPLFDKIVHQQKERSARVKEEAKRQITRGQKPFSFLETKSAEAKSADRRTSESRRADQKQQPRQAWTEEGREARIKKRAMEMLSKSQLPPRMEERKKEETVLKHKAKDESVDTKNSRLVNATMGLLWGKDAAADKSAKFKTAKKKKSAGQVPNFKTLQAKFEAQLKRRKEEAKERLKATKIESFKLSDPPRPKSRSEPFKPKQFRANPVPETNLVAQTDVFSKTTSKAEMAKEARLKELERKHEAEVAEKLKLAKKKKKEKELRKKLGGLVQAAKAAEKFKRNKIVQEGRKQMAEQTREYNERIAEMKQRVKQRPLLVEADKRAQERYNARKKALLSVKQSLESAGIKDLKPYFQPDELEMLDILV